MAEAKMQKINEEGTIKTQCLLLLLKSKKILDQFKRADFKQIISVHKRCVVISSPDPQIASIFVVVSFMVTVNPLLSPLGAGGGAYLFQAHLRGGLNRDGGVILEGRLI